MLSSADFFKIDFLFQKIFQEHYQIVKLFGSRNGVTFSQSKKEGKDQELIQSSTTPNPEYQSNLIWIQTICKGNLQISKVAAFKRLLFIKKGGYGRFFKFQTLVVYQKGQPYTVMLFTRMYVQN